MHKQQQRQGAAVAHEGASTTGQARARRQQQAERHAAWSWAADGAWATSSGRRLLTLEQRADLVATALVMRLDHHGAVERATDAMVELLRDRDVSTRYGRTELDRLAVRRWLLACWRPHGEAHPCWCDTWRP